MGRCPERGGFQPNQLNAARTDEDLLNNLAALVRELGRFPAMAEIKLKARSDPEFPSHNTFGRFGGKRALAAQLEKFCRDRGENDLAELCAVAAKAEDAEDAEGVPEEATAGELGYVYLMKAGRFYKVGRTNALGRRERELVIQLPEAAKVIHSIKTDDPAGIEEYWHRRFRIAARTANGSNSPRRILRPSEEESSCEVPPLTDFAPDTRGRKQRQMPNIRGGDHYLVTVTSHSAGLRGEDHVGVQRGIAGRLPAQFSGGCPKLRRLQHDWSRDRRITEHSLQRVQTAKASYSLPARSNSRRTS